MKKQFLVIGLGSFGMSIAKALSARGSDVLVIDKDKEKIEEISPFVAQAVEGEATDEKLLKSFDLKDFDAAIIAIGENFQASVLLTLLLKERGVKNIYVKVISDLHERIVTKIGADRIISPEEDTAKKIVEQLVSPQILEKIKISDEYDLVEIIAPKRFVNKSLKQLNLRAQYSINVIAIKKKIPILTDGGESDIKETLEVSPGPNSEINEGDILLVIGKKNDIEKLKDL